MNESSRKEVESVIEILGEAGKRLEAIIEKRMAKLHQHERKR